MLLPLCTRVSRQTSREASFHAGCTIHPGCTIHAVRTHKIHCVAQLNLIQAEVALRKLRLSRQAARPARPAASSRGEAEACQSMPDPC